MNREVTYQENRLIEAINRVNAAELALRDAQKECSASRKEYEEALNSNLSACTLTAWHGAKQKS